MNLQSKNDATGCEAKAIDHADYLQLYRFLAEHGITYQKVEHPAVFTCAEARVTVPFLPGLPTKNLFLRDKKGTQHFLVTAGEDEVIDLAELSDFLHVSRLSFGSSERLKRYLGVDPGSVSLLAITRDTQREVRPVFTSLVHAAESVHCHPLINTMTLSLTQAAINSLFAATGHDLLVWEFARRSPSETAFKEIGKA